MFLSQLSKKQVLIWSTGQVLSDQLLMAKLTSLLIFRQHFVNFCFPYSDGILARAPEWLMDSLGKMDTGPECL